MITVKKLSAWIKHGIKEYDEFLKTRHTNPRQNLMATTQVNNLQNLARLEEMPNSFKPTHTVQQMNAASAAPIMETLNQKDTEDKN